MKSFYADLNVEGKSPFFRRIQRIIFSCPRVGKRTNTNSKEKTDIFDFIKIKNFFTKKLN